MQRKMKSVLLMEASSRQVLPMAKALYQKGYEVTTVCEQKSDLGSVSRYKTKCYIVKDVDHDYNLATRTYSDLVSENRYDIVMPLSDFSANIAAHKKEEWTRVGCYVAVNDYDKFMLAFDKLNTMRICMENGIPCPLTLITDDEKEIDYACIKFPVVIKPRSACGSIGFHIVYDEKTLKQLIRDNRNGPLLIQEYIPQNGRQYNVHLFLDEEHEVKTAICTQKCRWFPIDGGASTLCRTTNDENILSMCKKLLQIIGWVGYCDVDLMEDPRDGSIRIIEINARISANIKICFSVGADIAHQIIELSEGNPVTKYLSVKKDYRLRCIHTDFLWFIKSPDRMKTVPSWFSFKRTTDQIFAFDDIVPFFVFSVMCIFRYKKEMKKRER